MSKIKINQIESLSSNADLELTPNGTGTVEIKSDDTDGTLQLNSIGNSSKTKIKAAPSSAAQNYTLILPDNQIAQDKYLQVASVTGSGSTAVGQLQYATVTTPSINLDASELTTGSLDAARLPSPLPATSGLGLKHVSTTVVNSSVTSISVTGLDADSMYRILVRNWGYSGSSDRCKMTFIDQSGVKLNYSYSPIVYYDSVTWYSYRYNPGTYYLRQQQSDIQIDGDHYGNQHTALNFIADLSTGSTTNPTAAGIHVKATRNYNYDAYNAYTNAVIHGSGHKQVIGGFELASSIGYQLNQSNLECVVYKYMEA
ncbi:MAG: hypothetical protein CMA50_01265 [Euryarchaeota archaeon]|nr:hypothetical protein [Euryarchaeota archaeon]